MFGTLLLGGQGLPLLTPYAREGRLGVESVTAPPTVDQYGVEEIKIGLTATYDNPFDPTDIAVDATVSTPSGARYSIPGFFTRPFDRALKDGTESVTPTGPGDWRVRLYASEVGTYSVSVRVKDRTGTVESQTVRFQATEKAVPGIARVSTTDHRYFATDGGAGFFPIGVNLGWGGAPGTTSYDTWLPKYAAQGVNLARLWLGPEWVTFGLEPAGKREDGKGLGQLDLGNAWRLDQVLTKAADQGIYTTLAFDSYNILRDRDGYPQWEKAPQNFDNGGPIRIWSQFWTNPTIDRYYRNKLRYLVARYAAFRNVFAWEFWNEVDVIRDFDPAPIQAWHQRMAEELKRLDPYHHLVTTSFGDSNGVKDIDLLPELDIVNTHHYGSADLAQTIAFQQSRKASWGKPHMVEEIGADAGGPRGDADPEGLQIHDPLWISLVTGGSGTAMPWWWDNYTEPLNLYPLFGAISRFTQGIQFPEEGFRQTDVELSYQVKPKTARRGDLELFGGPESWSASEFNRPRTVRLEGTKFSGQIPVSGVFHGVRNHPELKNPVRFLVQLKQPTRFEVQVQEVSGYGGAGLTIDLDGHRVLTRKFPDPDEEKNPASLTQFNGTYGLTIPAGSHTIIVQNPGNDWWKGGFRFVGLLPQVSPPVDGWALAGNRTALAWVRVQGRTWRAICENKKVPPPAPPTVFRLKGLHNGNWTVELWDTWQGTVVRSSHVRVANDGRLRVELPEIAKDLAIRARLEPPK